ncbi:PQQ-dependent sugar dehydrogenase [Pseudalkalibacillus sp. SCS-8]|uniref:PQQ-dependent sugar dehydrogenase n=1 Tax=Pseudalkalibacillus nanhaiensis TaxID=3115291 RepID=UPI0032DA05CF
MKRLFMMVLLIGGLIGCSSDQTEQSADDSTTEPAAETVQNVAQHEDATILANRLRVPWQINHINETVFYLSGRSGEIYSIKGDSKQKQSVDLNKEIIAETEGGLLGFLILDGTSEPLEAILYHTYEEDGERLNRVVKVQKQKSVWKETDTLVEGIPGGRIHNGGRLAIGPDDALYITTGDAGHSSLAQDKESLAGKILRINLDGTIPKDNPFPDSPVYSYGHRNPQGLGWTSDGKMYSTEHGSRGHDELNLILSGGNYGWPVIQGDEEEDGMKTPLFHSGDETWAPAGLAIDGSKIYVAFLAGEQIRVFDLETGTHELWKDGFGRMRDVIIRNGNLYTITNNTDGRGSPKKDDDKLIKFPLD